MIRVTPGTTLHVVCGAMRCGPILVQSCVENGVGCRGYFLEGIASSEIKDCTQLIHTVVATAVSLMDPTEKAMVSYW